MQGVLSRCKNWNHFLDCVLSLDCILFSRALTLHIESAKIKVRLGKSQSQVYLVFYKEKKMANISQKYIDIAKKNYPHEPEFLQTVE